MSYFLNPKRDQIAESAYKSKSKVLIITENDISGAKLQKNIEECSVSQLKQWLLCRGAKISGGKAAWIRFHYREKFMGSLR